MANLYVWSGAAGSGSGADWTNAKTTLTAAFVTEVAGDTLFVAHDHNESSASALTLTSNGTITTPTKVICVNRAGSVPPVSADRRTTAQVTTTGNVAITLAGCTHWDGIIFSAGTGATSSSNIICQTTNNLWMRFDNCSLRLGITSANGGSIYFGGSGGTTGGCLAELNNTTLSSAGSTLSSQLVSVVGKLVWRNTPSALIAIPNDDLFGTTSSPKGAHIECIGVDLSAMGAGKRIFNCAGNNQNFVCRLVDCKLNAAVTKASVPVGHGGTEIDIIRSGAAGVNYAAYKQAMTATLTEETTIVRSGGASDATTPIAWKVITTIWCNYSTPFECPPIAIWNDVVGSAVTATVEGIWGGGAVPNDDDVWLDVEYLGSSSSPQGSFVNDGKADLLATAAGQATSSATWGGSTTKFKMAVTFTPQQKGWIYARVKCAKGSSTFYLDPLVILT
jgi:hypothetical protein